MVSGSESDAILIIDSTQAFQFSSDTVANELTAGLELQIENPWAIIGAANDRVNVQAYILIGEMDPSAGVLDLFDGYYVRSILAIRSRGEEWSYLDVDYRPRYFTTLHAYGDYFVHGRRICLDPNLRLGDRNNPCPESMIKTALTIIGFDGDVTRDTLSISGSIVGAYYGFPVLSGKEGVWALCLEDGEVVEQRIYDHYPGPGSFEVGPGGQTYVFLLHYLLRGPRLPAPTC